MNKIKPCPFCGTEVELSKKPLWHEGHGYYNCFEFEIVCSTCGCNVRYDRNDTIYRTEKEAIQNVINAWNRREDHCVDGVNEVIDKIRAEIEHIGGDDEKAFCKNLNESYKQGLKDALKVIDKYRSESEE